VVATESEIRRVTPSIVLGTTDRQAAERVAALLRGEGASVTIAVGDRTCLRVASALGPDVLLLDPTASSGGGNVPFTDFNAPVNPRDRHSTLRKGRL
jgi:PIN domain nuclease of toxin-antitoxin system